MSGYKWVKFNPNPKRDDVGDCVIRAICKAESKDWDTIYAGVTAYGYFLKDMPSANHVWGEYLKSLGYTRQPVDCGDDLNYTVYDFCVDNPVGTFLLATSGHLVCVIDGCYHDTWNSGCQIPIFVWSK